MPDILGGILRATELIDEGLSLYERLKTQVENAGDDLKADTLEEALANLQASKQRALAAGNALEASIAARLDK